MKQRQHIIPAGAKTTFVEIWRWGQELERLHARIPPRFARPEPRRRTLAYLKGIVRFCGAQEWLEARPNTPEKVVPMGCNGYSTARSGTQTWCATSL